MENLRGRIISRVNILEHLLEDAIDQNKASNIIRRLQERIELKKREMFKYL